MALAVVDPEVVFGHVVAVALGLALCWEGRKTWRGEEEWFAVRYERKHGHAIDSPRGPMPAYMGTRRRYRSTSGSTYACVPLGLAFVLMDVAYAVQAVTGEDDDWWLWNGAWWLLIVLMAPALLLMIVVYPFFGVPDWLRPPCQRGWELVAGELKLVRPEAFHEHPKYRPPRPDDAARSYDPWR